MSHALVFVRRPRTRRVCAARGRRSRRPRDRIVRPMTHRISDLLQSPPYGVGTCHLPAARSTRTTALLSSTHIYSFSIRVPSSPRALSHTSHAPPSGEHTSLLLTCHRSPARPSSSFAMFITNSHGKPRRLRSGLSLQHTRFGLMTPLEHSRGGHKCQHGTNAWTIITTSARSRAHTALAHPPSARCAWLIPSQNLPSGKSSSGGTALPADVYISCASWQ